MKGYLYILETKGDHYYIGSTNNLNRRISEHQSGKTKSLKKLLPVKLVFHKEYKSLTDARHIEIKLKRFKNKGIINKIVKTKMIIVGP